MRRRFTGSRIAGTQACDRLYRVSGKRRRPDLLRRRFTSGCTAGAQACGSLYSIFRKPC